MSKKFVQYGAGNIGRGFIGSLFSKAGYEVSFIDVNMEVINALNEKKSYIVEIVSNEGSKEELITNVKGVNGMDINAVAIAISEADIMATSVGVNILPRIVPVIVEGLRKRWENADLKPLNIIICENLLNADKILHKLISDQLNDNEKIIFNEKVGLVEASIGRMVPVMTEDMKKGDPLRICVEKYCQLPVDKSAFKGEIPVISCLHPFSPFEFYIRRKIFLHNMGHAMSAYLGNIENCEYIYQSMANPIIKILVQRAMLESSTTLSKHFNVEQSIILDHLNDLLLRFKNAALGDTVARVGRDIKRKLSSTDRFAGTIKLCEEEGISTVYISVGVAAGLLFNCDGDTATDEIKSLLEEKGIDYVLTNVCELSESSISRTYIKSYFNCLKNGEKLNSLLEIAENFTKEILDSKIVI